MKHRYLASTLSIIAMLASGTWNSASAVTFNPPTKNPAPSQATGGASRGTLFTPAVGKNAPSQATGGASRGTLFAPVAGRQAPNQATGGASRGTLFAPVAGRQAPNQAAGGASRGNIFAPVAGRQTPNQAAGGASRAGIYYLNNSTVSTGPAALIALLPQNFYGTTVAERPTILVYLPDSNAEEAVFSLKDEAGNMQYQMTIPVAEKSGVVAIKLPADAPALAVGKNYNWFLALKINGTLSPSTPYVDGWIQRVEPNAELAAAMKQPDGLKQAAAFGKNGVWYDCVATLAALNTVTSDNDTIAKEWDELLSSVGLKEIVKAPVVAFAN